MRSFPIIFLLCIGVTHSCLSRDRKQSSPQKLTRHLTWPEWLSQESANTPEISNSKVYALYSHGGFHGMGEGHKILVINENNGTAKLFTLEAQGMPRDFEEVDFVVQDVAKPSVDGVCLLWFGFLLHQ